MTLLLNIRYEKSVNNQRKRENADPDFKSLEHSWGDRIPTTPIRRHRSSGKLYLTGKVQWISEPEYYDAKGNLLLPQLVEKYLLKQSKSVRQGTRHPVQVRDISLDHIEEISINKQKFKVKH